MKIRVYNKEVLFADEPIVKVWHSDIEELKKQSSLNERKRIRLCVHREIDNRVHEMLIIHRKDNYIQPHKHLNKTESFHIIEGSADIIIYDEQGTITEIIPMGKYGTDRIFYYRLSEPLFHTLRVISDYLVFHETTNGPFKKSDTIWAPWAPNENDQAAVNEFMSNLIKSIEHFVPSNT